MARAAPWAAMVMDARSGEVYHSDNADTSLHPASLTKMMTLWVAFEAVERGEITLDTMVTIPREAAAEPPSKLGLVPGQQIRFRYLLRAAAVRSANDAATAIAFAVSGSEQAFTDRMTRTARAMGMTRTTFRNAHGLTEAGHMSSARDMTILGRHMIYDWPQYITSSPALRPDAESQAVEKPNRASSMPMWRRRHQDRFTNAAGSKPRGSADGTASGSLVTSSASPGIPPGTQSQRVAELMDRRLCPSAGPGGPAPAGTAAAISATSREATHGLPYRIRTSTKAAGPAARRVVRARFPPIAAIDPDLIAAAAPRAPFPGNASSENRNAR